MSTNQATRSSLWKDCILKHDRPSQVCPPPPHVKSRQLPGSNFFTDPSLLVASPHSLLSGRINLCITSKVPRSSSFAGVSLTRSVTSSIKFAWSCGHQECLSNFQPVPKFVVIMPFPFPILNSSLLLERGTLITLGVASSSSVSPSPLNQLRFSSLSKTSKAPSPRGSCERSRPLNSRKGCTLFPSLQTRIDILPFYWV